MRVVQAGAVATTLAVLSTISYGYSFSEFKKTDAAVEESTGLITNEESRIYGGSEANIDKYPFLASLRTTEYPQNFCGGTLIAPQYILTAGQCVKTDFTEMFAVFGTNSSAGSGSGSAVKIPVIQGFRHPLLNRTSHQFDVGLLKLKEPVERQTAKLGGASGSENEVGTMATVLGWGYTDGYGYLNRDTAVLNHLTLPIISNAECSKVEMYANRITEGMLCAGTGNGKDACTGDAGGPLLVDDNIVTGIVSWGAPDCGAHAGVYTRVSFVKDYIEDILAGGDGSKFNVISSSTGSAMQQEE